MHRGTSIIYNISLIFGVAGLISILIYCKNRRTRRQIQQNRAFAPMLLIKSSGTCDVCKVHQSVWLICGITLDIRIFMCDKCLKDALELALGELHEQGD
jgi:hypothetical protein